MFPDWGLAAGSCTVAPPMEVQVRNFRPVAVTPLDFDLCPGWGPIFRKGPATDLVGGGGYHQIQVVSAPVVYLENTP